MPRPMILRFCYPMPVSFREWSTYAKSMVRYGLMPDSPCDLVTSPSKNEVVNLRLNNDGHDLMRRILIKNCEFERPYALEA